MRFLLYYGEMSTPAPQHRNDAHRVKRFLLHEERELISRDRDLRRRLWHHPFFLAFLGGIGVILFWRGIWHLADVTPFLSHPLTSLLVGAVILAATGLFILQLVGTAAVQERLDDLELLERRLAEKELAITSDMRREIEQDPVRVLEAAEAQGLRERQEASRETPAEEERKREKQSAKEAAALRGGGRSLQ
jgi:hypothetical protein